MLSGLEIFRQIQLIQNGFSALMTFRYSLYSMSVISGKRDDRIGLIYVFKGIPGKNAECFCFRTWTETGILVIFVNPCETEIIYGVIQSG